MARELLGGLLSDLCGSFDTPQGESDFTGHELQLFLKILIAAKVPFFKKNISGIKNIAFFPSVDETKQELVYNLIEAHLPETGKFIKSYDQSLFFLHRQRVAYQNCTDE